MSGPNKPPADRGYVALITAIMISMSLLVLVVAVSFEGFASRFTVLESTKKETSLFLAEACVQTVRLEIGQNIDYHLTAAFPEHITVGDAGCEIVGVTAGGAPGTRVIQARGESGGAVSNLEVVVDASVPPAVRIDTWTEVPAF